MHHQKLTEPNKFPQLSKHKQQFYRSGPKTNRTYETEHFLKSIFPSICAPITDITSCGIQQNHPIDGHKSLLALEAAGESHQLSAYVAAASSGGSPQSASSSAPSANGVLPESTGVGIGSVSKWDEPYFDDTTPHNVTALVGKSAYLSCRVKNLGNKTVGELAASRKSHLWAALHVHSLCVLSLVLEAAAVEC